MSHGPARALMGHDIRFTEPKQPSGTSFCCLFQGFHEYVGLLLKLSASVALPDVEGKTPLHWAASSDAAVAAAATATNNSNASHASAAK